MLFKIKQGLCANVLKGASQGSVDKEQFEIKSLQTICKVKLLPLKNKFPDK